MAACHYDLLRWAGTLSSPGLHWWVDYPTTVIRHAHHYTGYRIFPPSKWIAFSVCGWCVVSILQMVTFNLAGLLACRVFIGVFEGLFGTGIVYYLSLWYHRSEMGVRGFWFLGPTSIAG